jgi:transmembrane sensor
MLTDAEWTRVVRYVFGECAPADHDREAAWVDADPERRATADELLAFRAASPGPAPEWNQDRAWARLRKSTGLDVRAARSARPGWRTAAVVVVMVLGGAYFLWNSRRTPVMRQLATTRSQRVTLALGEGTTITLGPATVLTYPVEFPADSRVVELQGVAYFVVRHDAQHPLVVRTPRAVTEDVGTTFVVRDYAADPGPRISVVEGEVMLADRRRSTAVPMRLSHGQVGTIAPAGTVTVLPGADVAADAAWARGELVFRDRALREALLELDRWFDVDITLADASLGELRLTTSFRDESTTDALDALAAALRLRYEQHGRAVVFSRQRSAHGS